MVPSIEPFPVDVDALTDGNLPVSFSLLEGIFKTSVAAITLVDAKGKIIFANDAAEKVLGITRSSVTQRTFNASIWKITDFEGNPLPETELPFVRVMQTGEAVFDIQHAIELEDRERRYLSVNGSPLKDSSGTITHVVFSISDITDHIQSKKIQQEALEFYRQTFEASPAIKLLINPATAEIVDANPAAVDFYGYPIDILKQMKITDINQLPLNIIQSRMEQTCFEKKCCWHFPHRIASGEIRQVEVHSSRLRLQGRELLYSIIHDVTDRQRFEDALKSQLKQEQLLEEVTQTIRQSLDLTVVLQTTVNQVQQLLGSDRVIIYRLTTSDTPGSVLVESCSPDYPPLLGWEIGDIAVEQKRFIQPYQQGQSQAIAHIAQSDLDPAYVQLLETFQVKSQLTIPILYMNSELFSNQALSSCSSRVNRQVGDNPFPSLPVIQTPQIWGLLIVHHCASKHYWQDWEVTLLQRLEMQLAVAIQQAELYQQVQQLNTDLASQVRQRTIQLQKSLGSEAVLRLITDKIHGTLSEAAILQTAVQKLDLALNLTSCHASLYNFENKTATVHYEYTDAGVSLKGTVTSMNQHPEIYQPLLRGEHLQFCSHPSSDNSNPMSILCHPIIDDEHNVLGDLGLLGAKDRIFDQRDLQLVQQVAKQCAIAIRQSRLYQAAQAQIRELEKLNQLKDDFLNTTSHELRTPLSSIKVSTQLMAVYLKQAGEPINPKIERCLNILQDECDREINLINDLLLLQQLNANNQPIIPSMLNLKDWLVQIVDTFEEKFKEHQQTYQIDISPVLPSIVTDLFMFNHVMNELLLNAYKFTPRGGMITLSARSMSQLSDKSHTNPAVQISVMNTGVEISADDLSHVFDQFYRVPSKDPWKHSGTGLGLTLIKKLVQTLGGSIEAISYSGQTCFTVNLPLQSKSNAIQVAVSDAS